ncbi:phage scaffolding protein [Clostridium baratii]|uniref:phage scaffolding protein n=1 Tax=Clostridium baratii TaxID=1561 RepID=UPI0030CB1DAC
MPKLSEILGDSFNSLSEEIKTKYKDIDLVDSANYIEKSKYDEIKKSKKQLEEDIKERDTQLETLKKSVGDNEALKKEIETLQADNKKKDEDYQAELKDLRLNNAIKLALNGKVHDEDLVAGLIDKSKLLQGDDDKVMGLDEQIKSLQENKGFLFKSDDDSNDPMIITKKTQIPKDQTKMTLAEMMKAKNENPEMEINFQ